GDRAGEGRKRKIEPQGRENDEKKIEQRRPCPENDHRRGQISGQEIEQQGRKAGLDERVRIAAPSRKVSTSAKKDRDHAGGEQFVDDEGRERRQRRALGKSVVIDRPDE